jgi:hypothetical protein
VPDQAHVSDGLRLHSHGFLLSSVPPLRPSPRAGHLAYRRETLRAGRRWEWGVMNFELRIGAWMEPDRNSDLLIHGSFVLDSGLGSVARIPGDRA